MRVNRSLIAAWLLTAVMAAPSSAQQQALQDEALLRAAGKIRREIMTLPDYGVFDWITFSMGPGEKGYKVTLKGYASRFCAPPFSMRATVCRMCLSDAMARPPYPYFRRATTSRAAASSSRAVRATSTRAPAAAYRSIALSPEPHCEGSSGQIQRNACARSRSRDTTAASSGK